MPGFFSARTDWKLEQNAIARKVEELRKSNTRLLDLTDSNPTACGIAYPVKILQALKNPKNLLYQPASTGMAAVRKAVASYYDIQGLALSPEAIVLTASTSEAYSFVLRLLAGPGDHVIFPRPSYPLLDHLAQLNDVAIDRYFLRYDGDWRIDIESLRSAVTPRTRAIVLVHPNNPTGSFLKQEEWAQLKALCSEKNLSLISDEVFADYAAGPDASRVPTLAGNADVLTFTLGGISKMLGLPQMKLAWIAVSGPKALRQTALEKLEMIADTYLSVNTPAQNALPQWLKSRKTMQGLIRRRVEGNRKTLAGQDWAKIGCEMLPVEGGWNAILRIPSVHSEETWVLQLLETQHVLAHPGYFFDFESEAYLVLSLLPPPNIFNEGIRRIFAAVAAA